MHFTVVSYTFPPSKEIGGRRWAKFSQHLLKKGHQVTVVCANSGVDKAWYNNEFPSIAFKLLPKRYPDWLSGLTTSVKEKVLYIFFTRLLNPLTNKNIFDRGFAWEKPLLRALEDIHTSKKIDVLIVTGGPFSLLRYGARFKQRYNTIQYVCDIRDPWTWGNLYGIPGLSPAKKRYQEESEAMAVACCDLFCYPTHHMGSFLEKKYPVHAKKLYLLPHAYDPDKFQLPERPEAREGFIYGGTLYSGIEEYLNKLENIVRANADKGFKWDIYTSTHYPRLGPQFANGSVRMHPLIPEEVLFQKIAKSRAYLAFFPETDKDLVSTKFFEIVYTKTPILYIGEEGDVGRFIRENRLGVHILPKDMERELPKYLNGHVPFEQGYYDVTAFTFSNVTDKFLKELDKNRQLQRPVQTENGRLAGN